MLLFPRVAPWVTCVATLLAASEARAQWQAPYPQQPYPQPPYPQPPAPSPPPVPPPPKADTLGGPLSGGGFALVLGFSGARQEVTTYGSHRGWSGGTFLHLAAVGSASLFVFNARLGANLHGGANGLDGRFAGDLTFGSALRLIEGSELFYRIGVGGLSLHNDEIRASVTELPALQIGYQLKLKDLLIDVGPEGAATFRTEFEPGDEGQGRRMRRRLDARLAAGGFVNVLYKHLLVQGKALEVMDSDPLLVADGQVCAAFGVALCGFAQYWRSIAQNPLTGEFRTPEVTYIGVALGFGFASEGVWAAKK